MSLIRYVGCVVHPELNWTWTATFSTIRNSGVAYVNGVKKEYKDTTEDAFLKNIAEMFPWDHPTVLNNTAAFGVLPSTSGRTMPQWGDIFPSRMKMRKFV